MVSVKKVKIPEVVITVNLNHRTGKIVRWLSYVPITLLGSKIIEFIGSITYKENQTTQTSDGTTEKLVAETNYQIACEMQIATLLFYYSFMVRVFAIKLLKSKIYDCGSTTF